MEIFWPVLIIIFFVIVFLKRKSQLGKTWDGPLSATVLIEGKMLTCNHCEHTKFSKVEGLLTTTWITFFFSPFWNRSASCFVCKKCRHVHWFIEPKEEANITRTD